MNKIIENIRTYKVNNKLAPNAKIDLKIKTSKDISLLVAYIKRFAFANTIEFVSDDIQNASSILLDGLTIYIVDNIDQSELKERLEKELLGIESEIKRSEGLLNNENFISKAPKEKLALERDKYEKYKNQKEEILQKLQKNVK